MTRISLLLVLLISSLATVSCGQSSSEPDLDIQIGQMLMIGFRGLEAGPKHPIIQDIQQRHIGGVVLFDYDVPLDSSLRNIQSPEQVTRLNRQLQEASERPLFIAIDQEGGKVSRLKTKFGFPPTVSAQYLGSLNHTDSTFIYAARTAALLKELGFNTNLAPVVDVNTNPDNPIIGALGRSFSSDPAIVTQQAAAYIKGLHKHNIISAIKHFPGHGSSEGDSHKGFVDVTDSWIEKELIPYRRLIHRDLADMVMTAHIFNARMDSTYPATLSKPTINGILRERLDYQGVIISDDMQMGAIRSFYGLKEAIKKALEAGVDILVFGNNTIYQKNIAERAHRTIKEMVKNGEVSRERIRDSYNRIRKLKEEFLIK